MNRLRYAVGLILLSALAAAGGEVTYQQHAAMMDSLSRVHPRMRASWLSERGLDDSYYTTFRKPESSGLREVGRWPWGPSWELAGRDTFLYVSSGSGVRILSIADSVQPRMLGQIVCRGLVSQVVVQDSLLFVACGGWGAQVYSVADPANPRELGSMDAVISDVCVKDSLCYAVGGDSLRIYDVSNPALPSLVGAIRDSGDLVVVANGHAFSAGRWVTNIYNITNPANPVWANSLGGPRYAMFVSRNLLFCTAYDPYYMSILNVSDPTQINTVSTVNGYGGEDVYADDRYVYLSSIGDHRGMFVIDIGDSSRPLMRDSLDPEGINEWDYYVPHTPGYGYLADAHGGLVTLDLHDANSISEAWSGYKAHSAVDVDVDRQRAYIANDLSGLQIVDVADPTRPASLGIFDVVGTRETYTAVARDSFAFIGWWGSNRRFLRVLDVTNPASPLFAAEESSFNPPKDIVLGDTFIYAAEANRFQVFNVARPREPVLVGSCNAGAATSAGLWLADTVAYVANDVTQAIDVADPASPRVVGQFNRGAWNVSVRDTFAFVSSGGILVYSVADPSHPRLLDSLIVGPSTSWVEAVGSLLYVGSRDGVWVVDASDVHSMRVRGLTSTPYSVKRLTYAPPYLYASCWDAGVCILESAQVAVGEAPVDLAPARNDLGVIPNPASSHVRLVGGEHQDRTCILVVRDVLGKEVMRLNGVATINQPVYVDVTSLPCGLYYVEVTGSDRHESAKLVKQQ